MPKKRLQENAGLPKRWSIRRGKPYYQVPPGQEKAWDGKKLFKLGNNLGEAYRVWADRLQQLDCITTVGQLLDRYALEVIPTKAINTQDTQNLFVKQLKKVFGDQPLTDIEPQDIYKYVDSRSVKKKGEDGKMKGGPSTARREVSLLSHAYTKAVKWGAIKKHPFKGEIELDGEKPRTRYVEDWEIIECLSLAPKRKKDKVLILQAYIRLKLLTGLRQSDLLRLRIADCREDGIHVTTSKTNKPVIYLWSDDLRKAVDEAKTVRPVHISPFLFCTRRGIGYVNDKDKTSGWKSMWRRFMDRVIEETKVTEHFTEHDLRAKCASDATTLEHARALLAHTDDRTTKRIYRRKPEKVRPAR
jgi:integrase